MMDRGGRHIAAMRGAFERCPPSPQDSAGVAHKSRVASPAQPAHRPASAPTTHSAHQPHSAATTADGIASVQPGSPAGTSQTRKPASKLSFSALSAPIRTAAIKAASK